MRERILNLIDKDSKLTAKEIAALINESEDDVAQSIKEMEEEHVICGYNTLINWDKTERELVTAIIEVKVTPQRGDGFDKIAERIYRHKEVRSIYLMSGAYDFCIILEEKTLKEIAFFVSDKLSPIDSVISTSTHFVLKSYKDHGIIMEKKGVEDKRMLVSF